MTITINKARYLPEGVDAVRFKSARYGTDVDIRLDANDSTVKVEELGWLGREEALQLAKTIKRMAKSLPERG